MPLPEKMKPTTQIQFLVFILAFTIGFFNQENAFTQDQLFGSQRQLTGGNIDNEAIRVYSNDLNNDSLPDVICEAGDKVVWYENLGESNFNLQKQIIGDLVNASSTTSDIDGDGDMDLVYGSYPTLNDYEIAWIENNSEGEFDSLHMISTEVPTPTSIHASDVDNDGDMDLIITSWFPTDIHLLKNDGNGNFSYSQTIISKNMGDWNIDISDIDGDGDMDMICSYTYLYYGISEFFWIENDGTGNFETQHVITESAVLFFSIDDIDGDNDLDLLCTFGNRQKLVWFENNGLGFFNTIHDVDSLGYTYYSAICSADLDNDGDFDVLAGTSLHIGIFWYENTGSGIFGEKQMIYDNVGNCTSLSPADLNGDGYADFSAGYYNRIIWFKNFHGNTFSSPFLLTTKTKRAEKVCASDLDGDGDFDIISASRVGGKIAWYENIGYQSFAPQKIINKNNSAFENISVLAADVDNDLDIDIVGGYSRVDPAISWFARNELGGCTRMFDIDGYEEISSLRSADFNNDGKIDLLAASARGIQWYENLGEGIFGTKQIIEEVWYDLTSIFACDLDGDQKIDILFSSEDKAKIAYRKNDGNGNFDEQVIIFSGENPRFVWAADLDNDGDNDVIAAIANKVFWFQNLGSGVFGEKQYIGGSLSYPASTLYAADINNDGFDDVIYGYHTSIFWHENNGNGTFGQKQVITNNADGVRSVFSSDLDNDGDLDILSASFNDGKIAWYENLLVTSSVDESSRSLKLAIYPNPATNRFSIQSPALENESATVEIFDLYGRLIQSIEIPDAKSSVKIRVDHLQKGMYIVRLNGSQSYSCKLIKN